MRTMGVQRLEVLINTIFHVVSTWHHNNGITWADCRGPEASPTLKHLRMALHLSGNLHICEATAYKVVIGSGGKDLPSCNQNTRARNHVGNNGAISQFQSVLIDRYINVT